MLIHTYGEHIAGQAFMRTNPFAASRELSVTCSLTDTDRTALAGHIRLGKKVGVGVELMVAELLNKKLLYAAQVNIDDSRLQIASGGSRVVFMVDETSSQSGRLFHNDKYAHGSEGISVASLLGATLIGMKVGSQAPWLQCDGSFRKLRLIAVGG